MKLRPLLRPALLVTLLTSALAVTLTVPAGDVVPHAAYLQAVPGLDDAQTQQFRAGEKLFNTAWLAIPNKIMPNWDYNLSAPGNSEWGLGPTFLAQNCVQCHVQAGRGRVPEGSSGPLFQQTLRLSIPGDRPPGRPQTDPK